jgi:nucleoside-diphosphate-sugar epimerase
MYYKNKQVLVTGGAGIIGRELINFLRKHGAIIRCVDFVEKPKGFDDIDYLQLDLSDPESQFLFRFEPEYVFHLAADFERSEERPEFWGSNFRNNVLCSHYVINKIIKCPSLKKMIFSSSYLVYDKNLYNDTSKIKVLKEEDLINPRNLTGMAKLQTEMDIDFLSINSKGKFEAASARIFRVYGKGAREVISRWIRHILNGESITVFSEENSFDFISARDVAEGLVRLGEKGITGIYNLGSGKSTRISKVVDILKEKLGEFEIKKTEDIIFAESNCADMSKFKSNLKWIPQTTIEEGIQQLIEFEKSQKVQ